VRETYREGNLLVLPEVGNGDGGEQAPVGGDGGDGAPHGHTPWLRGRALDDHEPASSRRSSVGGGVRRGVSPRGRRHGGRRRRGVGGGDGEARRLERADGLQHLAAVVVVGGRGAGAGGPRGSGVDGGPECGGVEVAVVHGGGREGGPLLLSAALCRCSRGICRIGWGFEIGEWEKRINRG
jgi:hypothetical protein